MRTRNEDENRTGGIGRRDLFKAAGGAGAALALGGVVAACATRTEPSRPVSGPGAEFPPGFLWGVGTAAYQIEGAYDQGGRKPSIWDVFSHTPGKTVDGATGDVACDDYHLYAEDIATMAAHGVRNYRFSIAWPRIIPDGTGEVNDVGVDYYKRLVDELLSHGITPYATLYHWDAPQALQDRYGSWTNRQMATDFAEYVTATVSRLGDRIQNWYTINEVSSFILQSYSFPGGLPAPSAPGLELASEKDVWQAAHNALLGHGLAVQAVRAASPQPANVTIVDNSATYVPVIETPEYIEAVANAFRRLPQNGGVIVPVLTGEYDPVFMENLGADAPDIEPGDMTIISEPIDGLGFNCYTAQYVEPAEDNVGARVVPFPDGYPEYDSAWLKFVPDSIYWGVRMFSEALGKPDMPIWDTESGASALDVINDDGRVQDTSRILYLRQTLESAARAIADGYPLEGFFAWSYMDNFEWSKGYSERFGLTYVDFETQKRTPKESFAWYSKVIGENRVV